MATFLCTVEYDTKGHEVLIEVWVSNKRPPGQTEREEVEEVIRVVATTGLVPEGWDVKAINWSHPGSAKSGMDSAKLEAFSALISESNITVEETGRKPPRQGGR